MYAMITMEIVLGISGSVFTVFVFIIMVVFSSLGYGQKKAGYRPGTNPLSYTNKLSLYIIIDVF